MHTTFGRVVQFSLNSWPVQVGALAFSRSAPSNQIVYTYKTTKKYSRNRFDRTLALGINKILQCDCEQCVCSIAIKSLSIKTIEPNEKFSKLIKTRNFYTRPIHLDVNKRLDHHLIIVTSKIATVIVLSLDVERKTKRKENK